MLWRSSRVYGKFMRQSYLRNGHVPDNAVPPTRVSTYLEYKVQNMILPSSRARWYCRAVTYALKPDALPSSRAGNFSEWSPGARRQHGFIAQEVERVAPEVVAEDSNGYKTVAYSRLVPALAAALSDMLDRVDKLEHFGAVTTPAIAVEAAAIPPPRKPATYPSVGPESSDGSTYGRRGSMGGRRMADVTVRGQQGTGESKDPVFDLMQLWVENTALRSRVGEMEKKMAELERKFKEV